MNKIQYITISTRWGKCSLLFREDIILELILPSGRLRRTGRCTGYHGKKKWLSGLRKRMVRYFNGRRTTFPFLSHLEFSGYTPFQKKVVQQLMKVPYGERISYMQLAEKAGSPKACRCVGNIMAKNKVPLIIPCHRVIRSSGDIGSFGYGRSYKQKLLELEKII
ncbi:MAG: methylated-DNA--[protein]-cysteine S-methyltransferase [bacterium]|nr:methylated-DNA--[protein]-cysteine S-methyltransferase [bacterium]